jgi:hypothetical protein
MMTFDTPSFAAHDVDLRGFEHALEPVRQKQQWRLDRQRAELARAQRALAETDAELAGLQQQSEGQAEAIRQALGRLDPGAHRRALGYLAQLREQWLRLAEQRETQCAACDELRRGCVLLQLRIEGLARHKEEALKDYAHEARRRASTEQDRDWLARSVAGHVSDASKEAQG